MSARAAKPQPAPASRPGRFLAEDGSEWASINVGTHRSFAVACLVEWAKRDGKSRMWLLKTANSISVPAEVLEPARASLSSHEVPADE